MACSNKNLVVNGGFQAGLSPWTGTGVKRVKNPLRKDDWAVLMNSPGDVIKQTVRGPFEQGCAYYLYFRVWNASSAGSTAELFATVAYLDAGRNIIRSTPLQIHPPKTGNKWYAYFTIVPPPPPEARFASVSFLLRGGVVYADYIRLASHDIRSKAECTP